MYVLLLIVLLSLCGYAVDPPIYHFDADEIINQATKIELVVCENPDPVDVNVKEDTVLLFDFDKVIPIKTLEQEKIDDFAQDLSRITFHREMRSVNAPVGYTLLIYIQNHEMFVLSYVNIDSIGIWWDGGCFFR